MSTPGPDSAEAFGLADVQERLTTAFRAICDDLGVSPRRIPRAVHALLGSSYVPSVILPSQAPASWNKRQGDEIKLTPPEFLEKYWGKYIDADVLTQSELRRFDLPLFHAVWAYCRTRGLSPADHLPPPARTRAVAHERPAPARERQSPARPCHSYTIEGVDVSPDATAGNAAYPVPIPGRRPYIPRPRHRTADAT